MTIRAILALTTALLACDAALADRVAGIAGIPPARAATPQRSQAAPALLTGTVSGLRANGSQVEIDGKWYVLKPGRTVLLRRGLPLATSELALGQKLSFSLASAVPGEQALGVVHVP